MGDRRILYLAAFLRAVATGMTGVLLGIYLAERGLDPRASGLVVTAGLAGAAAAALAVTVAGERLGRRRTLVSLALLGAAGGCVVAATSSAVVAGVAAFFGMVNGMGRDRGGALILDQVILPAAVGDRDRTSAFAWYNVLQDAGHALGGLVVALFATPRVTLFAASALLLVTAIAYGGLSSAAEAARSAARAPLSPESRRIVTRISALFAVDSLGGGFLTASLVAYFFYERFGVTAGEVGVLFFVARVANAGSHLGAAWLARRIGLVRTMVFTHIPSSLLLVTVAWAPSFRVAALLFLLREALVEMDVPTRQSYVMAVVRPEERTVASGVTHLVRLGGWAVAPAFAGLLMSGASLAWPLIVGAAMKVSYDVMLYVAFRKVRPPEEQ